MRLIWGLIVTGLWAVAMAQKECSVDADCMGSQWCYNVSKMCVDYTVCGRYNRLESAKPAREASQCGKCIEGYSAELNLEPNGEAEICRKVGINRIERNHNSIWIGSGVLFAIVIVIIIILAIHSMIRCEFPCQNKPASTETERPGLLMVETGNCAIVPSAPSENMNNNKYNNAEETNPLSTNREYHGNFVVETSRPVKAQGFHPPNYIRTDPNYNPGDNQTVQTTFSPPDDEETNPSDWTPGPLTGTIPAQPFAAIAEEVQDNTSNTFALQRLACPSPSIGQEGQQTRQNNSSSGNSGGFGYNNTNGSGGNTNSTPLVQVYQYVNVVNPGNNGS